MLLHAGLDVGSTTVKLVVLNSSGELIYQKYARHFSDVKNTILQMLSDFQTKFTEADITLNITGSAGLSIAKQIGVSFMQEVVVCTEAIETYIPHADVAIELGGEDAKIIYLSNGVEQRMNAACAGGTGAFIDQIASLLSTDAEGLNEMAKDYGTIYPIASRCGVFAKTDVQPLLNEGARKSDIAVSVFQSVVTQTVAGLACGRPIRGKVAFLGGPLTYLSELRQRFIETLKLSDDEVIFPDNSQYYVALGAALQGKKQAPIRLSDAIHSFQTIKFSMSENTSTLPRLFHDEQDLEAFRQRHRQASVPKQPLSEYAGAAFLGIDAGSTTTKIILMDEQDRILFSFYKSNQGNPLETVIGGLRELYAQLPDNVYIAKSAITGYGENLIKAALSIDIGEIETVAHYKAAAKFSPNVDFILDIGGQDMKCVKIKNGAIHQLMLNEACSAGCGSFLESFAKSLDISIEQFANQALLAEQPVDLGSRCTVFMNSKVKQVQKEGVTLDNLSAGLSYSVIKNAIQKVLKLRDTASLGDNIIVQGGTFYNEAVLRAFELLIGREVVRPDIAGVMGAYGCALIAKEHFVDGSEKASKSSVATLDELATFTYDVTHSRCRLCGNNCSLTVNRFPGKPPFITGNRCERGAGLQRKDTALPNLYKYKYERIFSYFSPEERSNYLGTVGIPRVLNMYENYPFWYTFFTYLGYKVVLSDQSSKAIFDRGIESIPSEAACYPAKLTHGHIENLTDKGVDFIFYPAIIFEQKESGEATNHFNCPVVASYPEVIRVNMDVLKQKDIPFVQPFLTLDNGNALKKELAKVFPKHSKRKINAAVDAAYQEDAQVKLDIRQKGEQAIAYLQEHGKKGIVLAGRPYHIDPEIHHGISDLITSYDLAVLTEDSAAHLAELQGNLRIVNQWTYHARLYRAAQFVSTTDDLELVQLTSFGCGLDAVTADMVQDILESHQKMYTLIKIDEINNLGAARIRLRSLQAAMKERQRKNVRPEATKQLEAPRLFTKEMREEYTILIPQMSPAHFDLYEPALNSEGYRGVLLPKVHPSSVDLGLRYVNNDACYPAILAIGQLMHALQSGEYDLNKTAVIMSQTGGACRATNYIALLRKALQDAGMQQVPVLSLNASGLEKHPGFELNRTLLIKLIKATCYGDALMRLTNATRPYEQIPGSTDALYQKWNEICKQSVRQLNDPAYRQNIRAMVREFDTLPTYDIRKPKVGVVGEILVKYHPDANNQIVTFIEQEGGEAVVPDILDFFLYCLYDSIFNGKHLGKGKTGITISHGFIQFIEHFRKPLRDALRSSKRFTAPETIYSLAKKAKKLLSVGNQAGEGWFLTAEMIELIEHGVENIACIQPFACLPNHVVGRGMMKGLKELYPMANIAAVDYDASETEVNQINRLKLMISTAFKNMEKSHTTQSESMEQKQIIHVNQGGGLSI